MARFAALCAALAAIALLLAPADAHAYDHQVTLDFGAGWGVAPALADGFPDHGPNAHVGTSIGFDDTWGMAFQAGWAVHPPFTDSADPLHIGFVGVEGLYYIDILQVVPFFGVGVDVLPTYNGTDWGADVAAHVRLSLDYLVSREVAVGVDIRPYILLTSLELDPVYLSFQARASFLFDY